MSPSNSWGLVQRLVCETLCVLPTRFVLPLLLPLLPILLLLLLPLLQLGSSSLPLLLLVLLTPQLLLKLLPLL